MRTLLCLCIAILAATVPEQARAVISTIEKGDVVVVPLKGEVSPVQFTFLRRTLKQAEAAGASAFVLNMDTPGGRMDSAIEILNLLFKSTIPTMTYVNDDAASAGALIAMATKQIWMAPVSAIGAAAPVMGGGQEIPETMNDKIVSYYSGYFRSAAQKNGYNPDIAEAFINKDKEVKIGDRVIHPAGKPLTLDPQQATEMLNDKHVLATGIADTLETAVRKAGWDQPIRKIEPSGFETLAFWITQLAPVFLMGGIIGVYIEMKAPGLGAAGFVAAVCFLLFFAGHYIAGLTGMEGLVVFVLGLALVLIEVFFFPGFLVLAGTGIVLMVAAMLFAMVDYFPGQPTLPSVDAFRLPVVNLMIAIVAAAAVIAFIATRLPSLPGFNRLVLKSVPSTGEAFRDGDLHCPVEYPLGAEGIALSILRPAGRARFGNEILDVVSDGVFVEAGAQVRILRREGSRIIVEPA